MKLDRSHDEMQERHRALAETFGDQPARVVREAREHARLRTRARRALGDGADAQQGKHQKHHE